MEKKYVIKIKNEINKLRKLINKSWKTGYPRMFFWYNFAKIFQKIYLYYTVRFNL